MGHEVTYSVQTLRAGQPRAYADSFYEYLITIRANNYMNKEGLHPWLMYGDVEATIKREEQARKEGKLFGGMLPSVLRSAQRDWAKKIVTALCRNFRESTDEDGRTGMDAHLYPTLQSLTLDPVAGTIKALIVEPYAD